jgi:hypothetical protein
LEWTGLNNRSSALPLLARHSRAALAIDPSELNTLVLRQVPDHLYQRLKAIANSNRVSMNQEPIQALAAGLPDGPAH